MTDLFGPDSDYWRNTHEVAAAIRERTAVQPAKLNGARVWLVVRLREARAALEDSRLAKDRDGLAAVMLAQLDKWGHSVDGAGPAPITRAHMLFLDGPDHERLRALVAPRFDARVEALGQDGVDAIITALLDRIDTDLGGPVDIVSRVAVPVSMAVLCHVVGVPESDHDRLRGWSAALMHSDPAIHEPASEAMVGYLGQLIAAKRAEPADDLLSDLLVPAGDGDQLTDDELIGTLVLLLVPGHEATAALLGNAVAALLGHHRPLWQAMAEQPATIPETVEELLRLEGASLHATYRYTTEPVVIGGVTIPAGEIVLVALASANRDDQEFRDADNVCPGRADPGQHVAFGAGPHQCFGADLARMLAAATLGQLSARFPGARLAQPVGDLRRTRDVLFTGFLTVPTILCP